LRPIWKGTISFGMVTIPVKLYTATEDKDIRFRLLHKKDGSPIQEKRFCVEENKEVGWDELARGYEVSKGEFVILDPEEIEEAEPETAHAIEIGDFVELEEIDPIYFEKSYFLEPDEVGAKPFNLLREALEETGRVAVAKVAIRNKERLATIRIYDGTMVLETMYWPDEIRSTKALDVPEAGKAAPSPKELQMARTLVENLSDRFRPEEYKDRYRLALQELIERKMKGETRNARRRKPEPKIIDLMAALEASLRESKAGAAAGKRRAAAASRASGRSGARSGARAARGSRGSATGRRTAARRARKSAA
jgi:DNA end-binding protein Ku